MNAALILVGYEAMELLESFCDSVQENHPVFDIEVIFLRELGLEGNHGGLGT